MVHDLRLSTHLPLNPRLSAMKIRAPPSQGGDRPGGVPGVLAYRDCEKNPKPQFGRSSTRTRVVRYSKWPAETSSCRSIFSK